MVGQIVEPQAGARLMDARFVAEQALQTGDEIGRARSRRDHIRVGVDIFGVDPEVAEQSALPQAEVPVIVAEPDDPGVPLPLDRREIREQGRERGGVVQNDDAAMAGGAQPFDQAGEAGEAVETVDQDRNVARIRDARCRPGRLRFLVQDHGGNVRACPA